MYLNADISCHFDSPPPPRTKSGPDISPLLAVRVEQLNARYEVLTKTLLRNATMCLLGASRRFDILYCFDLQGHLVEQKHWTSGPQQWRWHDVRDPGVQMPDCTVS
jgi:hypothetical protein